MFLGLAGGLAAGCAEYGQESRPDEVRAFFQAANEANFSSVQSMSRSPVDLSGYTPLMGVKYPPTQQVEVLNAAPARPYLAFAVLESSRPSPGETYDSEALEGYKEKARAIGADAIIIRRKAAQSGVEVVAIKYRLPEPAPRRRR